MTIKHTDGTHPDFVSLCEQLDAHLTAESSEVEMRTIYNQHNVRDHIHDVFIAYVDDMPVGCAAFKQYRQGTAEVKRVFVHPAHRGKHIADALMDALEHHARQAGYRTLILETGRTLAAAHALYRKRGYAVIPNYDPYIGLPDSMCMQKELPD